MKKTAQLPEDPVAAALCRLGYEAPDAKSAAARARAQHPQASLEVLVHAALRGLDPAPPRPVSIATHAVPAPAAPEASMPPAAALLTLPTPGEAGTWLSPNEARVCHGQVWIVRTTSKAVVWAQIDGYDIERRRTYWRAINLVTRRRVQVHSVLQDSCPRLGGRRARAKR